MATDKLDGIFGILGTGSWNWLHYIAIGYAVSLPVPHALAGPFLAPRLKAKCRLLPQDGSGDFSDSVANRTADPDPCKYFAQLGDGDAKEELCSEWDFDNSTFTNTVTSEFELVCQRDYLRATFQSMYMVGVLVGSPLNGILADRYGRRLTFVGGCLLFGVLANISCWLPSLPALLVFRLLLGTMHTAILKTGFILAVEIANPKVRSLVGVTIFLPWGLGTIAWGGLAYLLRSWRYLLMAGSLPCLLLLPALWFMDESPRWLVVRGQHKRALEVLKKAARWNRVSLPSDEEVLKLLKGDAGASVEKSPNEKQTADLGWKRVIKDYATRIVILFRTPRLRIVSIVMHLDYFVLGMVYFGLSLSGGNFLFNVFSYLALMGLVEIPAYTLMAPIISRFGRKLPVALCYLLTGAVLLGQPFLPPDIQSLAIACALLGKMAISMSFQGNNLFASELFPTEVRSRGVSSSFMFSRVGSAISPFITDYLVLMYPWAPSVVFGGAAAIAGFATLTLWETLGLALPETISQLENSDFKPPRRLIVTTRGGEQDGDHSTTSKL